MPSENKNSTSTTIACGDPSVTGIATYTGTADQLLTTTTANNYGWISGTTSISTYGTAGHSDYRYAKEGEVYMDPDTGEWSIYISELGGWVKCEIEGIQRNIDEDGTNTNILIVSFGCSVSYMKKQERERKVMTEKYKAQTLIIPNFSGYMNIDGTLGTITITTPNIYVNGITTIQPLIYTTPSWTTYGTGTDNNYYVGDVVTTTTSCSLNPGNASTSNNTLITTKLI